MSDDKCPICDVIMKKAAMYDKLLHTVAFYADPDTYFAIGFFPDRPCGEFINDFEETEEGYKPGKRARQTLRELTKHKELTQCK